MLGWEGDELLLDVDITIEHAVALARFPVWIPGKVPAGSTPPIWTPMRW